MIILLLFFFLNRILFYTFLPWQFWNVFEIIYFFAQKKMNRLFPLNKGHSVWMVCLCRCTSDQNEQVWKIIVLTFYHQYTALYFCFFFSIYQITVISVAIQNIWTNENSCPQTLKQPSVTGVLLLWGVVTGNEFCEKCIYKFSKWHSSQPKGAACHSVHVPCAPPGTYLQTAEREEFLFAYP